MHMGLHRTGWRSQGGRRAGFTLVEIIFAMLVVVVALVGLIAVVVNCQRLDQASRETMIATKRAEQLMDDVRAAAKVAWDDLEEIHYPPELSSTGVPLVPCTPRANRWYDVPGLQAPTGNLLPPDTGPYVDPPRPLSDYNMGIMGACVEPFKRNLKRIRVEVRWSGVSGNRRITVYSLIGRQQP